MTSASTGNPPPSDPYGALIAAGMPLTTAYDWVADYQPDVALKWWRAGVTTATAASEWQAFGFTPATAAPWTTLDQGPADAAALAQAGVSAVEHGRSLGQETAGYVPAPEAPHRTSGIEF